MRMKYDATLKFFTDIMKSMQLEVRILKKPYGEVEEMAGGIRKITFQLIDYEKYAYRFFASCKSNTIYKVFDEFLFNFIIMLLPDTEVPSYLVIGPYTMNPWTEDVILNKAQEFHVPSSLYPAFKDCYESVPIVVDSSTLFMLVNVFAENIWGSRDAFTMQELIGGAEILPDAGKREKVFIAPDELQMKMKNLEEKYLSENEMLQAVAKGQLHKIEMYLGRINLQRVEQRVADRTRNAKNYAIITNTLLRKTVENCAVHPFHIDKVSSEFAKKIELQTSEKGVTLLMKEMVRKYTLLVKNHSLRGYSPVIRRVMINIDSDLAADLSLSRQAQLLEVNPSYLSTLFKKETGLTLTEYVTRKRIDQAIFLLNSTNMQIQTVAAYCGIPDLCYFTKTFKKLVGMTPTEYRGYVMR